MTWLVADFQAIGWLRWSRILQSGQSPGIDLQCGRRRRVRAYSVRELVAWTAGSQGLGQPVDFGRLGAADSSRISLECGHGKPEGGIVTGTIPPQRETGTFEDDFAKLGLGGSLVLTGLLAAVKIAETATGVVLTATGVLPGASPSKERAPARSGGE
ncbi:hypothetical protein AB0M80_25100 [Amycolatopsis sp. NPDC051045]|uniref:hypothetical protein n=1 Tax=Amycolatopsis sp. NPDC051045 TaxID=3156922 RepID=UPI003424D80B